MAESGEQTKTAGHLQAANRKAGTTAPAPWVIWQQPNRPARAALSCAGDVERVRRVRPVLIRLMARRR
jgi:hypothetical protein